LRGQPNFTINVPAGRYLVFLAPDGTGAPDIYGAFTRYSLCSPHGVDGQCEDHTPVEIAISAKAPRAFVAVDDWYLTDEVAGRIEQIRAAGGRRSYAEPLGAPRFSEYPSAPFDLPAAPRIDFDASDLTEAERDGVQRALLSGPNFAGHLTATLTRCGPSCGRVVLVDWRSGLLQHPAQLGNFPESLPCRPDEALLSRRDSRLMSVSSTRGTAVVTEYYVWNLKTAALAPAGKYRRPSRAFCAVAAR
jgi:hypothetical protein